MLAAYYDRSEHTDELFEKLKISKDQSYRENLNRYDGYELVAIAGEDKICYSIYSPKSVVDAMLSGVFDNYWNQTETYEALKSYIKS